MNNNTQKKIQTNNSSVLRYKGSDRYPQMHYQVKVGVRLLMKKKTEEIDVCVGEEHKRKTRSDGSSRTHKHNTRWNDAYTKYIVRGPQSAASYQLKLHDHAATPTFRQIFQTLDLQFHLHQLALHFRHLALNL